MERMNRYIRHGGIQTHNLQFLKFSRHNYNSSKDDRERHVFSPENRLLQEDKEGSKQVTEGGWRERERDL